MAQLYSQNSRYYDSDTTNGIPQCNLLKFNYQYTTTTVLSNETNRLDLVSYRVYNTPVHWWIIARFNSILNPNELPAGTLLKIPNL